MSINQTRRTLIRLVSCSQSKLEEAAPARDLYTGDLTRKALVYAERRGTTMIVSALYGIIGLDETIAPYDTHLGKMNAAELDAWGALVREQLFQLDALDRGVLLVHAGGVYVKALKAALAGTGCVVTSTFRKPTGLGYRKGFYARDAEMLS